MSEQQYQGSKHCHCHAGHRCHCCPDSLLQNDSGMSRRSFLAAAAASGTILSGLSWAGVVTAGGSPVPMPTKRTALKVLPVLVWDHAQRRPMRSRCESK